MATPLAIAREYFPDLTDKELNSIIWSHTGYPHWWHIGKDGNTPEECFRTQLAKLKNDPNEARRQDEEMDEILSRSVV